MTDTLPPPDAPTPTDPASPPAPEGTPAATDARQLAEDCARELKQRFPALFAGAPKPVKLRIQEDIQARAPGVFTKRALSAYFRRHTLSTGYLIALTRAETRFDLDGQPAGPIADEHRQAARDELARRRARQDERRAQDDQQRAQDQQERHERAALLRDFQGTRLTTANFCALKGIAPEALDALLARARQEAAEAPPAPPRPARAGEDRRPPRPGERSPGGRPPGERRPGGSPGGRPAGAPRGPRGPRPPR